MPVDIVLIGLGDIAFAAHLPALLRHRQTNVVGLVDPDVAARERASALLPEAATAEHWQDLPTGDVAYIVATPPWVSTGLAAELAGAGRYVLMEKPVAVSTALAAPLDTLDPAAAAHIQVGMTYRHHPALTTLRGWIADGLLGSPLLVRAHIYDETHDPADPAHHRRIAATLEHGSPIVHEGAHLLDWLNHLIGEPQQVLDTWNLRTATDLPGPNISGGRLGYADGTVAVIEVGWLTRALPECRISVLGSRGHAVLDVDTFALHLDLGDSAQDHTFADRTAHSFDLQLDRFVHLVQHGGPPTPSLADGLRALELAERLAGSGT